MLHAQLAKSLIAERRRAVERRRAAAVARRDTRSRKKSDGEKRREGRAARRGARRVSGLLSMVASALSRARSGSLDAVLARGTPVTSSRSLFARAERLSDERTRTAMAASWRRLLQIAVGGEEIPTTRVAPAREQLIDALPLIDQLTAALRESDLSVQGLAMSSRLLTDGGGPVYNRRSTSDLQSAVREVLVHRQSPPLPVTAVRALT